MPTQSDLIEKAIAELYVREKAFEEAVHEYTAAEADYKEARAEAYLKADGTVADRNAAADSYCSPQYRRKVKAEAIMSLTKLKLEDCRNVISARQSMLSAQAKAALAVDMHSMKTT